MEVVILSFPEGLYGDIVNHNFYEQSNIYVVPDGKNLYMLTSDNLNIAIDGISDPN